MIIIEIMVLQNDYNKVYNKNVDIIQIFQNNINVLRNIIYLLNKVYELERRVFDAK
jgi:hypothetical protein